MARVVALQYGDHTDRLTGVRFQEQPVDHPTVTVTVVTGPGKTEQRPAKVFLGVAEVSDEVARAFVGRPGFHVEGVELAPAEPEAPKGRKAKG